MTNSDPQMLLLGHPRLFSRDVAQVSPSFVCLGVLLISESTYALALRAYRAYRAIQSSTACSVSRVIGHILLLPECIAWLVRGKMVTKTCGKYHSREPKVVVSEDQKKRWNLRQEVKAGKRHWAWP